MKNLDEDFQRQESMFRQTIGLLNEKWSELFNKSLANKITEKDVENLTEANRLLTKAYLKLNKGK